MEYFIDIPAVWVGAMTLQLFHAFGKSIMSFNLSQDRTFQTTKCICARGRMEVFSSMSSFRRRLHG